MERVCAVVTAAVPELMASLRKSLSVREANAVGGNLDNSLSQNGMDDTNFKRLLGMLYTFRVDEQSYIHKRQCLFNARRGGAYFTSAVRGKKRVFGRTLRAV